MITVDDKLIDIYNKESLRDVRDLIVSSSENMLLGDDKDKSLKEFNLTSQKTWSSKDMAFGLSRLEEIAMSKKEYIFSIYSEEECKEDQEKNMAKLVYFPCDNRTSDKLIILASGGAYGAVCNLAEAFPVAAKLNQLGYSCFCLCYRVASKANFTRGLLPRPIEDFANAYKFIRDHNDKFNLSLDDYIGIGFSAGGHVVSAFGCDSIGYKKYDIPEPEKLILVYPLLNVKAIHGLMGIFMKTGLFGKGYKRALVKEYSPYYNITSKNTKFYILQAEDDQTVPVKIAKSFARDLNNRGIRVKTQFIKTGNHGFGLGSETEAKDWVEQAMKF